LSERKALLVAAPVLGFYFVLVVSTVDEGAVPAEAPVSADAEALGSSTAGAAGAAGWEVIFS